MSNQKLWSIIRSSEQTYFFYCVFILPNIWVSSLGTVEVVPVNCTVGLARNPSLHAEKLADVEELQIQENFENANKLNFMTFPLYPRSLLSDSLRSLLHRIWRPISRYHHPSDAAIRFSLRLNLKCPPRQPPASKYAHVWQRGHRWRQELGRNSFLLQDHRATAGHVGGSANHAHVLGCTLSHIGDKQ